MSNNTEYSNIFRDILNVVDKINKSHSETPVLKDELNFEKRKHKKTFKPLHKKILMRKKSIDEYNKLRKEVKYSSFLGLDDYGQSNAVGKKRLGITKEAAITRFTKKKKAANLKEYMPNMPGMIDLNERQVLRGYDLRQVLDGTSDIYMDTSSVIASANNLLSSRDSEYLMKRAWGELDNILEPIDNDDSLYYYHLRNKKDNGDDTEVEVELDLSNLSDDDLIDLALDIDQLEEVSKSLSSKDYAHLLKQLKKVYVNEIDEENKTDELDEFYGLGIANNFAIVKKQCPLLANWQVKRIANMIKDLTNYDNYADIRATYLNVFEYLMTTCYNKSDLQIETLFDYFTLVIPINYQAMMIAEISIIDSDMADRIGDDVLNELTTLIREYLEVLPTKVETLLIYLDGVFAIKNLDVDKVDILKVIPMHTWEDSNSYPAILAMLKSIRDKTQQYAELFEEDE